jgi:DNA polymerase Ligase (LigD)
MPRYVILEHDYPSLHWDFMLESGDILRTWRLTAPPQPGSVVPTSAAFDHRPMYLDYEGPVGGSRGRVVRWDHGTFSWQKTEADCIVVDLNGLRLRGALVLERVDAENWVVKFAD